MKIFIFEPEIILDRVSNSSSSIFGYADLTELPETEEGYSVTYLNELEEQELADELWTYIEVCHGSLNIFCDNANLDFMVMNSLFRNYLVEGVLAKDIKEYILSAFPNAAIISIENPGDEDNEILSQNCTYRDYN